MPNNHSLQIVPGDRVYYEQADKTVLGILVEIVGTRCMIRDESGTIHNVSLYQTGYLPTPSEVRRRRDAIKAAWTREQKDHAYWRARSDCRKDGRGNFLGSGMWRPSPFEIPTVDTGLLPEGGREWM